MANLNRRAKENINRKAKGIAMRALKGKEKMLIYTINRRIRKRPRESKRRLILKEKVKTKKMRQKTIVKLLMKMPNC